MNTTNVKPIELNYNQYVANKYDRDIVNSIPYHHELHNRIGQYIKNNLNSDKEYRILDLGVGTGITTKLARDLLPKAYLDVIDFSKQMLRGAKKKLGNKKTHYICDDYAKHQFSDKYDIVISVIGLHHQNKAGKKRMFKKIYNLLKPDGVFFFGDLMTYQDQHQAATNNALHYEHLVRHATDKKTLSDWAYHHMFLNDLAPLEDQIKWLRKIGFKVQNSLAKMNTVLLICKKI